MNLDKLKKELQEVQLESEQVLELIDSINLEDKSEVNEFLKKQMH